MLVIDDPHRRLGDRVEDLVGIETLDDARRHFLQQVFALLQQDLMATGHVYELDDRGSREQARDQMHRITNGFGSEATVRLDEKVIRDHGKGQCCGNGRAATEPPCDRSREQDKHQQERLDARQAQGPGGQAQCRAHHADRYQRHAVRNYPPNHAVITIRNWRSGKTRMAQYQLDEWRPAQLV